MSKLFGNSGKSKKVEKKEVETLVAERTTVQQDAKIKELVEWCMDGEIEQVKKYIKDELYLGKGLDIVVINGQDYRGYTALNAACQNGYTKIVVWLLSIPGINVNRATFEKVTPMHSAMANRHAECVALLLAKGAEVSCKNNGGETPLDVGKGKALDIYKIFEEGTKNGEAFKVLTNAYPVVQHIRSTLEEVIDKDLETKENLVVSPRKEHILPVSPNVKREDFVPQLSPRSEALANAKPKKAYGVVDGNLVKLDQNGNVVKTEEKVITKEVQQPQGPSMDEQLAAMRKAAIAKKKNLLDSSSEEEPAKKPPVTEKPKAEPVVEVKKPDLEPTSLAKPDEVKKSTSSDAKEPSSNGEKKSRSHRSSHGGDKLTSSSAKRSDRSDKDGGEKKEKRPHKSHRSSSSQKLEKK